MRIAGLGSFLFWWWLILLPLLGQNLSGKWSGTLTQENGGPYPEYFFVMELEDRNGNITGYTEIYIDEERARFQLTGTFDGKIFSFKESRLLEEKTSSPRLEWCLKKGRLVWLPQGAHELMQGLWEGRSLISGPCVPGAIYLKRKSPQQPAPNQARGATAKRVVQEANQVKQIGDRKIKEGNAFEVSSNQLVLNIFDHQKEDEDIVSLYLDGKRILKEHKLSSKPFRLKINLDPGIQNHHLILYAEDLGKVPPN
ncbi:MAG: hypothetical protein AAGI38_20175, partial [Bacteroidota bacterium]